MQNHKLLSQRQNRNFSRRGGLPAGRAATFLLIAVILGVEMCGPSPSGLAADVPSPTKATAKAEPIPLNPQKTVFLDKAEGRLLVETKVVLQDGLLEMLCCLKMTKEHESILSVDAKAYTIHAGLLALGAQPGRPVRFTPEFQPPTGQTIKIMLNWTDAEGTRHRAEAQTWIRTATKRFHAAKLEKLPEGLEIPKSTKLRFDTKFKELTWYGIMTDEQRDDFLKLSPAAEFQQAIRHLSQVSQPQPMQAHWVFSGSGFQVDDATGEKFYMAESGDLICVANFASAMLDVDSASSASGMESLLYEANPSAVPPVGTPVLVELIPVPADAGKPQAEKPAK